MTPGAGAATAAVTERLDVIAREAGRRAAEIEAARNLPRDLVEAVVGSGVFLLTRPEWLGGLDAGLGGLAHLVERVAYHDGSTAWCILAGLASGLDARRLPRHHAETILGDPRGLVVGSREPGGRGELLDDGSLRVSGRWSWGSAVAHASWIGGGVRILAPGTGQEATTDHGRDDGRDDPRDHSRDEAGGAAAGDEGEAGARGEGARSGEPAPQGPPPVYAYFRRDQVVVLDTWYSLGLRGSGSTDFLVTEAVVPEGRWVPLGGGSSAAQHGSGAAAPEGDRRTGDPDRTGGPDPDVLLAIGAAAVALGLASRAIDELAALGGSAVPAGGPRLADWPPARLELARAAADIRASRAALTSVVGRFDAGAPGGPDSGGQPAPAGWELASVACHGVERSVAVVERCYRVAGAGAVAHSSPLQRLLRDVEVVAQHPSVSSPTLDGIGRALFAGRSGPDRPAP